MIKPSYTLSIICFTLLPAAYLPGQTTIPSGLGAKEGATRFHVPQYNPSRFQAIYGSTLIPGGLQTIKGFRLRADGLLQAPMQAHTYEQMVWMSNQAAAPLAGYGIRWDTNHGKDRTLVFPQGRVSWPASTPPAAPPSPVLVDFPLQKPFPYTGGTLVLDVAVTGPATAGYSNQWYVDSELGLGTIKVDYGRAIRTGQGCPHSRTVQENRFTVNGYYPHLNGPFYLFGDSQAKGKKLPAFCLIGPPLTSWSGLTLPFSLGPLGAYGCHLYVGASTIHQGTTDPASARGRVTFDMGNVPGDPTLVDQQVATQLIVSDPAYNSLGLRASDLMTWIVGIGFSGSLNGYSFYAYEADAKSPKVDPVFCTYSNNFVPILQLY